jgi:hypothetical protein
MKFLRYSLLILILIQLPFVYQVCQTRTLDQYISSIPREGALSVPFEDLKGSIHIHSAAGSHSLGTYLEIIEAAKLAGYDYLFLTDHPKEYELFNQIQDPELVMIYGVEEERDDSGRNLRSQESEVKVYSLFETDSVPEDVTGLEIFNLAENAKQSNNPISWLTWLYHKATYEGLFFFHFWELKNEYLQLWDEVTLQRPLAAVAGNNAHQNVGVVLVSGAGERIFSLFVDPYLRSLQFVTNHVLVPKASEVTESLILQALSSGASYIAFEKIADPTGFSFHAIDGGSILAMGSQVPVGSTLVFQSPIPSRFQLRRSGSVYRELEGSRFELETEEAGVYRVEVYPLNPPRLIRGKPWIISNPIYVQQGVD